MDTWKGAGIEGEPLVMSASMRRDLESASTYPGSILQTSSGNGLARLDGKEIASPANRWGGANRGAWSNAEFDLLLERYNSTLDLAEHTRSYVQMMKIYSDHVPTYPLHFNVQVVAHVAAVTGPEETRSWNIHLWDIT
jgi:ABC-type transport system substrate-binding protein